MTELVHQTDEVVRSTLAEDRPTSVEGIVLDHTSATDIQTGSAESELDIKSPSGQNIPRPLTTAGKVRLSGLSLSNRAAECPTHRERQTILRQARLKPSLLGNEGDLAKLE